MNNDWKPEKNISSPWDVDVWENNIGQPVKPSGDNLPYPYTTPPLKIGPSGYKLDPDKLKGAPQSILPYLLGFIYFHEDYEYFDIIKPYLDIPEEPKTLDEITQGFDEKIDVLIKTTKEKFECSKETAEYYYNERFDRIFSNFQYAKKYGYFPEVRFAKTGTVSGSYLVSTGSGDLNWITPGFVIKQGNKHDGYYTIGDGYYRFYMKEKPNMIFRWVVHKLMGFKWIDKKDT